MLYPLFVAQSMYVIVSAASFLPLIFLLSVKQKYVLQKHS